MTRRCEITGKQVMSGNNVSHAKNRTRRRFLPNMQNVSFYSEVMKGPIRLRTSTRGIRTIEKMGGIDQYLLNTEGTHFGQKLKQLKKVIESKMAS